MADQFDRPAFWSVLLDSLEAFLKADSGIVSLLTKTKPDQSGTFVDVAQGITPNIPAPCIRILRGNEGAQPLTGYQVGGIPQQISVDFALCAQSLTPRDSSLSAKAPWDALGNLEAATLAALRRYFARPLWPILGGYFEASVQSITPTDGGYYPVVGSTITIILNRAE